MHTLLYDLKREIKQSTTMKSIIVYRYQNMLISEFKELQNSEGGLLAFNSFLLTSIDEQSQLTFYSDLSENLNIIGVLFDITVNLANQSTPFTSLGSLVDISDAEKQFLFSIDAVFQISSITPISQQSWRVQLTLMDDHNGDLKFHVNRLQQDISGRTPWHTLIQLLIKMDHLGQAAEFCQEWFYRFAVNGTKEDAEVFYNKLNKSRIISLKIPDNNQSSINYEVENFDNEFKFISNILSIEDKIQYPIISNKMAKLIVPLIHKHFSVENIYLYASIDDEQTSNDWMKSFPKVIESSSTDFKKLVEQIINAIDVWFAQPLVWNRSSILFYSIDFQSMSSSHNTYVQLSKDPTSNECIVIYPSLDRLYPIISKCKYAHQFSAINDCTKFIVERDESSVFFIISSNTDLFDYESIINLKQIHAIYYFNVSNVKFPKNTKKISGYFDDVEDLFKQLDIDLKFNQQKHLNLSHIYIFSKYDPQKILISQLNKKQIEFLIVQLFVYILNEIPSLTFTSEEIINELKNLQIESDDICQVFIEKLINEKIDIYENGPLILKIASRFVQKQRFHSLLMLSKALFMMSEYSNLTKVIDLPAYVYRAEILFPKDLELLKSNCNAFINISTILFGTRSILTARQIARTAANNGLIAVLFEIELPKDLKVLNIDKEYIIFPFGTIFRLNSINQGPDDVWYAKINFANLDFKPIIDLLQYEIDISLTWLTFGNYLQKLHRNDEAENYFKILLEKLSIDHTDRSSIYNNIGLMYTMIGKENDALQYFNLAEKHFISDSVKKFKNKNIPNIDDSSPTKSNVDRSTILEHMADIYFEQKNYQLSIENYEKAFESRTDPNRREICRKKISRVFTEKKQSS
ncbi:unnamed protein product [Rotaria sp. Silwood2]|nr:unnamed protein product [Rotaria sp. Silwood2]CAF3056216.1 unnamed protein product [Rotaria sp. Silwood2]CAF3384476.1 unnamed protein product [Rotaria sp. Silwood2]CAF4272566.1 unnamed protein product [Rotaria sp. Silwood2]CAF4362682.1 unnamed protein product [Rotaria sp. Silwood2]